MAWTIELSQHTRKQLRKIDTVPRERILRFLDERVATLDDPRALAKQMEGEPTGRFRFRVGDYRIISFIHDKIVTIEVIEIGHRREVYDR